MSKDLDKALKDYEPVFDRPTPVRYDVLHFNDDHRRLDALMRRHYNSFHPLVRDIFTSFSLEFSLLQEKVEKMNEDTRLIQEELEEKRKIFDQDLDERVEELKENNEKLEQKVERYEEKIAKLEEQIKLKNQIIKEKDATIVTQRRQLDLYIDKETQEEKQKVVQQEELSRSIAHVNGFTDELEKIEIQMKELEEEKAALQQENDALKNQLEQTESQYLNEINEINQLYTNLKSEFNTVLNRLEQVEQEKSQIQQQLPEENSKEDLDGLMEQNKQLQQNLATLKAELDDTKSALDQVQAKNDHFKEIAGKILKLKDRLEEEAKNQSLGEDSSKQVIHPADGIKRTKRWSKKKSKLEEEIETDGSEDQDLEGQKRFKNMRMVDTDLYLDNSVSMISSKIQSLDDEHDLVRSIRSSVQEDTDKSPSSTTKEDEEEDSLDLSSILLEDLKKSEIADDEYQASEPETTNLSKVLARLDNEDVDSLNQFAEDFPKPPKSPDKTKEEKDREHEESVHS